jgi:hypothetical protein
MKRELVFTNEREVLEIHGENEVELLPGNGVR